MKISNRDWVNLSSYLDGELPPGKLRRFEDRLKKEPALHLALEELRQTKTTLAYTPKMRVPRNFILTPAMVGMETRPRKVRGYRLVSALMTFLLIGVLVLDFGRSFVIGSMAPAAPKEVMLEAVSDSAEDSLEVPALMEAEGEMESDRAVAGADSEAEASLEDATPALDVAAEAVEEGESVGVTEEATTKSGPEETGDTAANQAEEWQEDEIVEEMPEPSQTYDAEVPGTPSSQLETSEYFPQEEIQRYERAPSIDPFRILEIIFGLGALAFGVTAWMIRRRNSR